MPEAPPSTIFYSETGGKTSPFYRTLGGIKSALKTTWKARYNRWDREAGRPEQYPQPPVYRGTIVWEQVDPQTGEVIG